MLKIFIIEIENVDFRFFLISKKIIMKQINVINYIINTASKIVKNKELVIPSRI